MKLPETRYVTVGGAQVVYPVVGDGPQDLAWCYAMGGHVDLFWEVPSGAELLRRLLGICKVVVFDRRGSGASDAVPANAIPTWEELAEDLIAVLDAAGSQRTALMAWVESGTIAALFAMILVLPAVFQALPSSIRDLADKFLPGSAGQSIFHTIRDTSTLPPWIGLAVFALYAATALTMAW